MLKNFKQFINESNEIGDDSLDVLYDLGLIGPTQEQIDLLNDWVNSKKWEFDPKTGLINVDGSVLAYERGLTDFKGIRFGKVSNRFHCFGNQLTSLEGAPQEVGGDFNCSNNRLTSLEGAPSKVGEKFICVHNYLTTADLGSLEGKVAGKIIFNPQKKTRIP